MFTCVRIGSALSLANFASGCAVVTTYTAYHLARITFAGTLASSIPLQYHSLESLVKTTPVAPYVPLTEFAKSIIVRSPSKLVRFLQDTRPFSIPR